MRRTLVWILAFGVLLAGGAQAGELQRIRERGEVVVSLNRGTPPFCLEVQGQPAGIDADLARRMAEYLGVRVRFVFPDAYAEQIPRLLAGESDVIIAAMTRTPERGLQVAFTDPYFEVSQAALVRRNRVPGDAASYFDLVAGPGLRIGVKADTTMEAFARQLFPEDRIRTFPTHEEAVAALLQGQVEASVHDSPFVRFWETTHREHFDRVKALLAPTTRETYGFAIRQGDADFLQWLNLFIAQVRADGTLDLLTQRYLVEVAWTEGATSVERVTSNARLLYDRFLARRQEMRERGRREAMEAAGAPY